MSEKRIENRGPTAVEITVWIIVGVAAVVWLLTMFISQNSFRPDVPLAWMGIAQWVASVTVVPAILLSGIRALLPDNRIG